MVKITEMRVRVVLNSSSEMRPPRAFLVSSHTLAGRRSPGLHDAASVT